MAQRVKCCRCLLQEVCPASTIRFFFSDIDGNFPNHHPDPTVEKNLVRSQEGKVAEVGADLGIGFDGDGDRIGAIDQQGRRWCGAISCWRFMRSEVLKHASQVPPSLLMSRPARPFMTKSPSLGGKPLMWKTGHSLHESQNG
jgi:phosphomannomutase